MYGVLASMHVGLSFVCGTLFRHYLLVLYSWGISCSKHVRGNRVGFVRAGLIWRGFGWLSMYCIVYY